MNCILDICTKNKVPIHIDSAWFGSCRNIDFDYSHPMIESVAFSLSKGLGLGQNRTGIQYTKKREPGPITITNDFNSFLVWMV